MIAALTQPIFCRSQTYAEPLYGLTDELLTQVELLEAGSLGLLIFLEFDWLNDVNFGHGATPTQSNRLFEGTETFFR